jgi:hypothetical protein
VVRAALDVEDLDPRSPHSFGPSSRAKGDDVLGVVGKERVPEAERRLDPWIGDPVVVRAALPASLDETAPAETGEVVGDSRLRQAERLTEFSDAQLHVVAQELEDAEPARIAEAAKVLRQQVGGERRGRDPERGGEGGNSRTLLTGEGYIRTS